MQDLLGGHSQNIDRLGQGFYNLPATFCTETSDSEILLNMLKVFIYTFCLHPTLSVYDLGINNSLVKKIKLLKL